MQNTSAALATPAPLMHSAGLPLAMRGATIASIFDRPQTTLDARAPQAPTAALEEPATATRATPDAATSCAGHTVSAVPAQFVAPHTPALAFVTPSAASRLAVSYPLPRYRPLAITPPGDCMKASKGGNYCGLRYHPPCYHTPCGAGGMLGVPNISHRTAITPHEKTPRGDKIS